LSHNPHGTNHSTGCYVVEEVVGRTVLTTWDKEEARQLANSLLLSGKNAENSLAIRRVACSKLPPPIDENGNPLPLPDSVGQKYSKMDISFAKCKKNEQATIGFCIQRFDLPEHVDISSVTRKKQGDHYVVFVALRGSWDPLHKIYLNPPLLFEIWHRTDERSCDLKDLHNDWRLAPRLEPISKTKRIGIRAN